MNDASVARAHWDNDAARYIADHADYLADFYWCPERLREEDAQLLGDVSGQVVVEIGAGTAPCADWLAERYPTATVIATDISHAMLRHARHNPVQADAARLPVQSAAADVVFSSFGAFAFLQDLPAALREVTRVLAPGGRCVIAANNPFAWVFQDDPGPEGLIACIPYWRTEYREPSYVEYHHTFGDWVRAHAAAGLALEDVVEPEWPEGAPEWGQWSPLRGSIFPGTQIFISRKSAPPLS